MDPATLTALLTFGGLVIGGLPAIIIAWKNNAKIAENTVKLEQIHTLTNSNLSKITTDLQVANERIEGLEKLIVSMKGMEKKS